MSDYSRAHSGDGVTSDEADDDSKDEEILQTVLDSFEKDARNLGRTQQFLTDVFNSDSTACLICIEVIKRSEPIWTCVQCFCMFHMQCIQRWVKEGSYQASQQLPQDLFPERQIDWLCPKCRHQYKQDECPKLYRCFCNKVVDPPFDPWLIPHSCGQTCDRELMPNCGHRCLLLCHPGPCPPCPKTLSSDCYCGKAHASSRRCANRFWSCGKACGKLLACKQHYCKQVCHENECLPCNKESLQKCLCKKNVKMCQCAKLEWRCEQACGKALSCGHHKCDVCHTGSCGDCLRGGAQKTCPCGKSRSQSSLSCLDEVPTCGDTCNKLLACGLHRCLERCHTGPCGTCREFVTRKCRCRAKSKSVMCGSDYTCEIKCNRMKECNRHVCKRKCCDGKCPPCEQMCGRTLSCRNHKCNSSCHSGLCYPCPLTVKVACNCGNTVISVPCGREKFVKLPSCNLPCQIPPDCHHSARQPHRCHFGPCPPCRIICNKALSPCGHPCPQPCHSSVLMKKTEQKKRAGPWEPKAEVKLEVTNIPCPPCRIPISVLCLGEHEACVMACSEIRPHSCGNPCGRLLSCGNHSCQKECHVLQEDCGSCESQCVAERPHGCTHECLEMCHNGPCKPCRQMVKLKCHCQLSTLFVECSKWTTADAEGKQEMTCCQNECPRQLLCGHRCSKLCHQGACLDVALCTKKSMLRCACKRRKKEVACNEKSKLKLKCDEKCQEIVEQKRREDERKKEEELDKERKIQEAAMEEVQRKLQGRKRKHRKRNNFEEEEESFWQKYRMFIIPAGVAAVIAVLVAVYFR